MPLSDSPVSCGGLGTPPQGRTPAPPRRVSSLLRGCGTGPGAKGRADRLPPAAALGFSSRPAVPGAAGTQAQGDDPNPPGSFPQLRGVSRCSLRLVPESGDLGASPRGDGLPAALQVKAPHPAAQGPSRRGFPETPRRSPSETSRRLSAVSLGPSPGAGGLAGPQTARGGSPPARPLPGRSPPPRAPPGRRAAPSPPPRPRDPSPVPLLPCSWPQTSRRQGPQAALCAE